MTPAPMRTMALSVWFKQPDLGMKSHEILSRSTAFLLNVDPPTPPSTLDEKTKSDNASSPYGHLDVPKKVHQTLKRYPHQPAGGPSRDVKELGWLEFCPADFRPTVHVVASSHVISPWRWRNYYPQSWVSHVKPNHCSYTVDVFCPSKPNESLATFALNPYPIHHPQDDVDIAIMHLKQEETVLKHLRNLGVQSLDLRDMEDNFSKGEEVSFEGFEVAQQDTSELEDINNHDSVEDSEDRRTFFPYTCTGSLIFQSPTRILSSTDASKPPLPQGLCGGPVIDQNNKVCGVVEGIVPIDHQDNKLAGSAAFIPSYVIHSFLEHSEKYMLEKILPNELFLKVIDLKAGKALNENASPIHAEEDQEKDMIDEATEELDYIYESMKKYHTEGEVEAIKDTINREKKEVQELVDNNDMDLDEAIDKVRERSIKLKQRADKENLNENDALNNN